MARRSFGLDTRKSLQSGARVPRGKRRTYTSKHLTEKSVENVLRAGDRYSLLSILCALICAVPYSGGQTRVTTWHYNNKGTGASITEPILAPANGNVNVNRLGRLFIQPVDGFIVGHPLYMPASTVLDKEVTCSPSFRTELSMISAKGREGRSRSHHSDR